MMTKTQTPTGKTFSNRTVLLSGLLVGTLDILSAFVDVYFSSGKNPLVVLPFIASGAFGKPALAGGAGMMLIGLLFHYLIAFSFTVFFFWIYKRIGLAAAPWIVTGILYGIFIWLIMNLIVVQLSAAPHAPISAMKWPKIIKSALILICMIGLPLSYIAHKANARTNPVA
ncbi:MAG: hypothetical protein QM726_19415 [Chitinophagaceae bacterium]